MKGELGWIFLERVLFSPEGEELEAELISLPPTNCWESPEKEMSFTELLSSLNR